MPIVRPLVPLVLIAALAACQQSPGANQAAEAPAADAGTGVQRQEVQPSPAPAAPVAPPAAAAIRTGPGPEGNTVSLDRVAVTGDILTVSLTYSGSGSCCVHIPIADVSVIDDATSQRIGVLKDNSGKWMAAPLGYGGKNADPDSSSKPSVVWFKFPAPPATTQTVSIAIPGVAPFDAVPVNR